ncbi:MAG: carboxypeptidase-like regulatory domain-containing protein [Aureliella sp.]
MKHSSIFLTIAVLLTCAGCGDDTPPLGQLNGVVTIDGKPFVGGSLQFIPEGGGRPSVAVTDENGEFEALYLVGRTGALIGSHKVLFEVNDASDVAEEDQFMPPAGSKKGPKSYKISPDVIEVASGANEIELKLST